MLTRSSTAAAAVLILAAVFVAPASSRSVDTPRSTTDHFVFYADASVTDAEVASAADRAEDVYERLARFLGRPPGGDRVSCTLYPTLEAKGLATGYTLPAHAMPGSGEVFAAVEPGFEGEAERALAGLLIRRALGRPRVEFLEVGLEMHFTKDWRGLGYRYWAARAGTDYGSADLGRLFDNRRLGAESDLFVRPLAGAFVDWAIDAFGRQNFLEKYEEWEPAPGETARLEAEWREWLERLYQIEVVARDDESGNPGLPGFHRGFCHAHEGYQIHNGYISARSDEALEKLQTLGVNAVSITPFTYMRNPGAAAPLPFSQHAGAENDEGVIHAAMTARRLGMSVMIKPHVWIHGGWPGDVEMATEADWAEFFEQYWRWIRHYELMCEMYDFEMLCVGVELERTTGAQGARWRELIGRVRRIYDGKVIYAANWGGEVESLSFWDALDYIGVNCYYPLSDEHTPDDAALREGVERALDRIDEVARKNGRPVIITEVGFVSAPGPWVKPYERDRRAPPDEDAQSRCYEAFFEGLAGRTSIVGVYWWKWPSFLEYGGSRHSGFTPNGKAAEGVVKKWFTGDFAR